MTPYAFAVSLVGSPRIGKSAFSDSANALLPFSPSTSSTLAMKYATSYARILSPLAASDLHSIVQPDVNALGNQASTTAFLPLNCDSVYVFPSLADSLKSGAASPTFSSCATAGPAPRSATSATRGKRVIIQSSSERPIISPAHALATGPGGPMLERAVIELPHDVTPLAEGEVHVFRADCDGLPLDGA